jgi:diphthamide synthase subunit DPH2
MIKSSSYSSGYIVMLICDVSDGRIYIRGACCYCDCCVEKSSLMMTLVSKHVGVECSNKLSESVFVGYFVNTEQKMYGIRVKKKVNILKLLHLQMI